MYMVSKSLWADEIRPQAAVSQALEYTNTTNRAHLVLVNRDKTFTDNYKTQETHNILYLTFTNSNALLSFLQTTL